MRYFSALIIVFFVIVNSYSQDDENKVPKNPEYYGILKTADNSFDLQDYRDAMLGYEKLLKLTPAEPQVQLRYGISLLNSGKVKTDAIPYLKAADSSGIELAKFYLGKAHHLALKFDSARMYYDHFKHFSDKSEARKLGLDKAIAQTFVAEQLIAKPVQVKIANAGTVINSPYSEYGPVINADHSLLYFTSRRPDTKGNRKDSYERYFEDIYYSSNVDGNWTEAKNADSPINSKEHDATVAMSADGRSLIIYRTDPYTGEGDLYSIEKAGEEWLTPVKMGLNINSSASETSASLNADGQIVYFSSDRDGGYGGMDIYKSFKGKNGVWGKAINLGNLINTSDDDDAPFIHPDGKTLFYSSKGHEINMGGYDIYKAVMSQAGVWAKPANMGFPINSVDDETYFVMTADARKAYFSSGRTGTIGEQDIFSANFKNDTIPVSIVKGVVLDDKENKSQKVEIKVSDQDTGKDIGVYKSDSETGEFMVILPENKNYKILIEYNNLRWVEIFEKQKEPHFRIIEKEARLTAY